MAGEAVIGAETQGTNGPFARLSAAGRILRNTAGAVLDVATDERTVMAVSQLTGPQRHRGLRVAAAVVAAVRAALRAPNRTSKPRA